ncbi:MAG: DUF1585 domain-containing protein [Myxococcota bacterium]|nr:DUF1585 domain-containing protein [Myxococcota bacterium]
MRNLTRQPSLLSALCLLILGASSPAMAQAVNADETCAPPEQAQDKYKQLRTLSLELRGHPPSAQEYADLEQHDRVPEAWLDEWLSSKAFAERTVRWHKSLLWNNVTGENLFNANSSLRSTSGLYWRSGRIATDSRGRNISCLNQPAQFDADGEPIMWPQEDGTQREGYVRVAPYWNPDITLKVCALDARDRLISASGTPCGERTTIADPSCGCGPNLRFCATGTQRRDILQAMGEQIDHMVRDMILEGKSYETLFTDRYAKLNGPLAYYWRYQTGVSATVVNRPVPMNTDLFPDMRFDQQDEWVEVDHGEHYAGILTSAGYLLRFQTDRARANQFYTNFLCQPFQPPPNGIQTNEEAAKEEPDLQQRDGCKYCHGLLEPAAAHWGRWPERGAGYLSPSIYPAYSEQCESCAKTGLRCSSACSSYYVRDVNDDRMESYAGYLSSYLWLSDKHRPNIEQGPKLLARSGFADGRLSRCVARQSAEHLLGRELTSSEQDELLPQLTRAFASSDYNYAELVRAIVTSPAYRRVR